MSNLKFLTLALAFVDFAQGSQSVASKLASRDAHPLLVSTSGCKPIVCPEDINDMYFPHPERCGAFCQCSNGTPYEFICPEPLNFNPNLNVCDWPENYDCAAGAHDCQSIDCPEDINDMYFPHPGKCSAFCQCSNGTPYEMPCPPGLVFDPNINVCVLPENYDCPLQRIWIPENSKNY